MESKIQHQKCTFQDPRESTSNTLYMFVKFLRHYILIRTIKILSHSIGLLNDTSLIHGVEAPRDFWVMGGKLGSYPSFRMGWIGLF